MLAVPRSLTPAVKVILIGVLIGASIPALSVVALSVAERPPEADGSAAALFHTLKCQLCHAVPAADIEAKAKSDKVKGADLGTADSQLTAEEMVSYIRQETEIDGEQHKKAFKGTDEELATIVNWLLALSLQARDGEPTANDAVGESPSAGEG